MTLPEQLSQSKAGPWFQRWFDSVHYHKLYGNRNEQEAAAFIDELVDYLELGEGSSILDLGCGAGRHSKHLATQGFRVTGIDLSSSSIREARKWETESLHFLRRDMRDPFGVNCFDYVFNFFTSFGYFKTSQENNQVVRNMSSALKKGGRVVLDYMNVQYVEERLIPYEEKEIDGVQYYINRWTDQKFIYKKIAIDDGASEENFKNIEQVAKFTLEDFNRMFLANSLEIEAVFGDYSLSPFYVNTSPRLIMIARQKETFIKKSVLYP